MSGPVSCWVVSDGRRGIENQALGLAEAMTRQRPLEISKKTMTPSRLFKAISPGLQFALRSRPGNYNLSTPYPKIMIGCGRQAIAPLRSLKKAAEAKIFTAYIQSPRMSTEHFDLVIAPNHDRLHGTNVFTMIGSPNRITPGQLKDETAKHSAALAKLSPSRIVMLIGGNSRSHTLDNDTHVLHMQAAIRALEDNRSLLITTSRRTPKFVEQAYRALAAQNDQVWYWDGLGENPYFAFLGAADAIMVSEDSTNMLTEACATGKPVFRLPMKGRPGKFSKLYDQLGDLCNVSRFNGKFAAPKYERLAETDRVATEMWRRFDAHFD